MKVLASAPRAVLPSSQPPFGRLLAEARAALHGPVVPPGLTRRAVTRGAVRVQEAELTRARSAAHAEASRLCAVRSEGLGQAELKGAERVEAATEVRQGADERLIELILRELHVEAPRATPPPPTAAASMREARQPESRAAQAEALIAKIERFLRSQRPGLALTLNNGLAARVEIERMGPREVAVKLVGQHGPPSAEAVSRVREELRARGLRVGALSVE